MLVYTNSLSGAGFVGNDLRLFLTSTQMIIHSPIMTMHKTIGATSMIIRNAVSIVSSILDREGLMLVATEMEVGPLPTVGEGLMFAAMKL